MIADHGNEKIGCHETDHDIIIFLKYNFHISIENLTVKFDSIKIKILKF